MPDLKVLIGGRNYHISCNPGEENAAVESANLLNQEAELVQEQLGRLTEEKLLLLSGLLLGDKIRALKHERNALEETLRVTQSKFNELSAKVEDPAKTITSDLGIEHSEKGLRSDDKNQSLYLQNISDLLDGVIRELEKPDTTKSQQKDSSFESGSIQDSFL